jgi:hypothetical protein
MRGTPLALNVLSGPHLRAGADGDLAFQVSCCGAATAGCRVVVTVKSQRRISSRWLARGRSRIVSLARRKVTLPSGSRTTVTVRLSGENLALLHRMQTIRAIVRVTATDEAGHVTTASRLIRLHAPARPPIRAASPGGRTGGRCDAG